MADNEFNKEFFDNLEVRDSIVELPEGFSKITFDFSNGCRHEITCSHNRAHDFSPAERNKVLGKGWKTRARKVKGSSGRVCPECKAHNIEKMLCDGCYALSDKSVIENALKNFTKNLNMIFPSGTYIPAGDFSVFVPDELFDKIQSHVDVKKLAQEEIENYRNFVARAIELHKQENLAMMSQLKN